MTQHREVRLKHMHPIYEHALVPRTHVTVGGKTVGFAYRGHRELDVRGQKIFSRALELHEEREREIFRSGRFEKYKSELLAGMKQDGIAAPFVDEIETLTKPTHIDYTGEPEVAAILIHKGYRSTKLTISIIEDYGMKKNATPQEQIEFLNKNRQIRGIFVFLKEAHL